MTDTLAAPAIDATPRFAAAKAASRRLGITAGRDRDRGLESIAAALLAASDRVLDANARDLETARAGGMAEGLQDRLRLDATRVARLADAVLQIAALPDPVGEVVRGRTLPNGLHLTQVRVPFGVVGAIYEARPNVTVDITALALKSGNAVVLRGGTAAQHTNGVLVGVIRDALADAGLPAEAVQSVDDLGRDGASQLMRARGLVDVLVPRGSASLIDAVVRESTVPVTEEDYATEHMSLDISVKVVDDLDEAI
ncbi:MAG: aldehyde dehydrogenase family protein, partial [Amnibacterium sp.]